MGRGRGGGKKDSRLEVPFMTISIRLLAAALLFVLAASADAGKFNKKLNVGDAAPTWDKLEAIDGK
jgi:hypothetical protein